MLHLLGLAVLWFFAGTLVVEFRLFPYGQLLKPAFAEWHAYRHRPAAPGSLDESTFWATAQGGSAGVVAHDAARAGEGYTFFTSPSPNGAVLIDSAGQVVHVWRRRFDEIWPSPPHIDEPVPGRDIIWRRARLLEDGSVLVIFSVEGDTPYGYGLAKLDRESRVIWKASIRAHHELDIRPDGTILVLTQRFRDTEERPVRGAAFYPRRVLEDFVVELSPSGEVRRRVSVLRAIAGSSFRHLLRPVEPKWDALHTNDLQLLPESFARHHGFAEPGQLLISIRNLNVIGLLDLERGRMVWARQGPWRMQHSPVPLSNGRIMLFDNRGRFDPKGRARSRIVECDPGTKAIPWSYGHHTRQPLHSEIRGCVQPLPNGNVLITESQRSRLLEVTRSGEIVWAFRHPLERRPDRSSSERYRPIMTGAARVSESDIDFKFNWRKRVEAAAPANASPEERARISWSLLRDHDGKG